MVCTAEVKPLVNAASNLRDPLGVNAGGLAIIGHELKMPLLGQFVPVVFKQGEELILAFCPRAPKELVSLRQFQHNAAANRFGDGSIPV